MSSAHREEDVTKTKALSPPRGAGDITPSCAPQDASASAIDSPVAGRPHPREARMTTSESKSTSAPREHAQSRTTEPRDGGGGGGEGGADRGRARIRDTRSAPESRDGGGRDGGSDTDRQGIFERIRDTRSAPPPRAAALAAAGRLLQLSAPLPAGRLFTVVRKNRSTDKKEILFGSYVLHGSPFLSSWMPSKKEFEAPVECSCEIIFRFCERAFGNQF